MSVSINKPSHELKGLENEWRRLLFATEVRVRQHPQEANGILCSRKGLGYQQKTFNGLLNGYESPRVGVWPGSFLVE